MSSLAEAEVWRRLRRGELVGRSVKGHLYIYQSLDGAPDAAEDLVADQSPAPAEDLPLADAAADDEEAEVLSSLPPLPPSEPAPHRPGASAGPGFLTLTGDRGASPELALLLDHLSLAKEENREILRMTQDSIRKVSELSETVVEMKDAVIEAKEAQILALREQLAARDHDLRKLRQQNEDLEMLSRAIASRGG